MATHARNILNLLFMVDAILYNFITHGSVHQLLSHFMTWPLFRFCLYFNPIHLFQLYNISPYKLSYALSEREEYIKIMK